MLIRLLEMSCFVMRECTKIHFTYLFVEWNELTAYTICMYIHLFTETVDLLNHHTLHSLSRSFSAVCIIPFLAFLSFETVVAIASLLGEKWKQIDLSEIDERRNFESIMCQCRVHVIIFWRMYWMSERERAIKWKWPEPLLMYIYIFFPFYIIIVRCLLCVQTI